jgi:predicted aspartyl protease
LPKAAIPPIPYTNRSGYDDPLVEITLIFEGKEHKLTAYADTGCTSPLMLSKRQAAKYGFNDTNRESDEPEEFILADGSTVAAFLYSVKLIIGGREIEKVIPVIDPDYKLPPRKKQEADDEPLLGRGVMDDYNMFFEAKCIPKTLHFHD